MNEGHLQFLASPEWARMLETDLLPWLLGVADLGNDVLEVGPGPGLTTDLLRQRAARLTAVEVDAALAAALAARLAGTNVEVIHCDATSTGLPSARFSAATSFSMIHHMPAPSLQDQMFAELYRVLRPGGVFVGTDSRDLDVIRAAHIDDVFVPVDPDTLVGRLEEVGFATSRSTSVSTKSALSRLSQILVHDWRLARARACVGDQHAGNSQVRTAPRWGPGRAPPAGLELPSVPSGRVRLVRRAIVPYGLSASGTVRQAAPSEAVRRCP